MYSKTRQLLSVVAMGFAASPLLTKSRVANAADVTVDLTDTKQAIRGFGASSAWSGTLSTSIMDSLYTDLGYSILRVRIEENIGDGWSSGNYGAWQPELTNAKNATERGAIVFASPWNPPASMKSGGKLMTSRYGDYAEYLKTYAKYFADNGAPLYAISIQNEPDYANDWTAWTATDLHDFLAAQGAGLSSVARVMMPESFQFRHAMSDPSLNDATVASYISIVGGHLYGAGLQDYPLARGLGKELWQTEHYFDDDQTATIMEMAKDIHDCMVTASMNAYVYWWITWPNGLSTSGGTLYKRAYTLGQFAKYIRPGYYRVEATENPAPDVNVSAYAGDDKVVIVVVNTGTASVDQNFTLSSEPVSEMSSWQTTASSNMVAGESYAAVGGSFMAALPGQSITTFVGEVATPSGSGGGASDGGAGSGGASSSGGSGGFDATGGLSGAGGATVTGTGGNLGSGGLGGTGGAAGGTGGTTTANTGGTATGASSAGGNESSVGTAAGDDTSGCSCTTIGGADAGADARRLGGGVGSLLVLCGVAFGRRRRRARGQPRPAEPESIR